MNFIRFYESKGSYHLIHFVVEKVANSSPKCFVESLIFPWGKLLKTCVELLIDVLILKPELSLPMPILYS